MNQLKRIGNIIAVAGELLGLVLSIVFLYETAGMAGAIFGAVLFPFTWAYLPLYELFTYHSWDLILTNYGSLVVALVLYSMADPKEKQPRSAIDEPPTHPVMTKTLKDYLAPAAILLVISGLILAAVIYALSK
jgi:hypothetical protein